MPVESDINVRWFGKHLAKSCDDSLVRMTRDTSMQQSSSGGMKHGVVGPADGGTKMGGGKEQLRLRNAVICPLKVQAYVISHAGIPSSFTAL
jgi:hypothetical protein